MEAIGATLPSSAPTRIRNCRRSSSTCERCSRRLPLPGGAEIGGELALGREAQTVFESIPSILEIPGIRLSLARARLPLVVLCILLNTKRANTSFSFEIDLAALFDAPAKFDLTKGTEFQNS